MSKAGIQLGLAASALALALCFTTDADAQWRRYSGHYYRSYGEDADRYRDRRDYRRAYRYRGERMPGRDSEPADERDRARDRDGDRAYTRADDGGRRGRDGATFGAMVEQLIRLCDQQAAELRSWPFDRIAQYVKPDETQRKALEELRGVVAQGADRLASDCPRNVAAAPLARLEAAGRAVDTVIVVVEATQPALQTFYGGLDDEQKARLVGMQVAAANASPAAPARSGRARRDDPGDRVRPALQSKANCEGVAAALRDWPVGRIERSMQLTETQRVAFYEVVGASLKAAGTLITACPADTALTPVVRADMMRRRLGAIQQAVQAIQPVLVQFYESLDNRQQMRFAEMD
jgi:LTXXQ motif family protein